MTIAAVSSEKHWRPLTKLSACSQAGDPCTLCPGGMCQVRAMRAAILSRLRSAPIAPRGPGPIGSCPFRSWMRRRAAWAKRQTFEYCAQPLHAGNGLCPPDCSGHTHCRHDVNPHIQCRVAPDSTSAPSISVPGTMIGKQLQKSWKRK